MRHSSHPLHALLASCLTIAVALLLAGGPLFPEVVVAIPSPPPQSESAQAAVGTVDAYERQFDFEGALGAARAGLAQDSTSYDLWWRLARAQSDRGQRAEFDKDKEKAKAAYVEAVRAGRRATALFPDGWEGHQELARALGRQALFSGGKEKIRLSKEVKTEADRAIALNPNADRAYHLLGRWNRGIAQLSFFEKSAAKVAYGGVPQGASMDAAVTWFEKAVSLAPDYANHRLELGRTYLDLGLTSKAREQLERALACPPSSPFDAEYRTEAHRLLGKAK